MKSGFLSTVFCPQEHKLTAAFHKSLNKFQLNYAEQNKNTNTVEILYLYESFLSYKALIPLNAIYYKQNDSKIME